MSPAPHGCLHFRDSVLENLLPNDNYNNVASPWISCRKDLRWGRSIPPALRRHTARPLATLSGTVYYDLNADNQQEAGEAGIAGVTLYADGH